MLNSKLHAPKTKSNAYVVGRFDDLKPIGNPVFNHKVEQVLRAVAYPYEVQANVLITHATQHSMQTLQHTLDAIPVGISNEYGYALHPSTCSFLVRNGIKPNVFLTMLVCAELDGERVLAESPDGILYLPFVSLHSVAYAVVLQYKRYAELYDQMVQRDGVPKFFAVQGVYNNPSKLYEVV